MTPAELTAVFCVCVVLVSFVVEMTQNVCHGFFNDYLIARELRRQLRR